MNTKNSGIRFLYVGNRKWAVNAKSGKVMKSYIMDRHNNWKTIK